MDAELLVPLRSLHSACAINLRDGWMEGGKQWQSGNQEDREKSQWAGNILG